MHAIFVLHARTPKCTRTYCARALPDNSHTALFVPLPSPVRPTTVGAFTVLRSLLISSLTVALFHARCACIVWMQVDGSPYGADGGVGLTVVRTALAAGKHAVLANKAPLVAAFDEIATLAGRPPAGAPGARAMPPRLKFSATVCGGLPVVNVGTRDLGVTCATFSSVEGVFNSTTNYILAELGAGRSFEAALKEAQRLGIAEVSH